mmetsp:Transcript_130962/g.292942  ORF Transcript_130962/g.292942 Transcript_130962/m.292942 type:complete len:795 (+) Transcript_130962:90-2474(+)
MAEEEAAAAPAEEETQAAAPAADAPMEQTAGAEGEAAPPEKKKRGKPKDPNAPPKPKNAYQRVTGEARPRIKEEKPELAMDLKGMADALKAEWDKTPDSVKEQMTKEYEEEMVIWRPKWDAYKQTPGYKIFFEEKQDWIDARQQKKLAKEHKKVAPKRPQSGYMIFAGTVRDRIKEAVMAAGGGMGDIGVKISEEWNALSETKKAEFGEQSQKQKEVYDKEFAVFRLTDTFKNFCNDKAKLEAKQKLKKNFRMSMQEAPKKPQNPFSLYRSEIGKQIEDQLKGLSMGERGKKFAELWKEVPEEKKAEYGAKAAKLKEEYDVKIKAFKRNKKYIDFLHTRYSLKSKENKQVNLRDMPKRPKSVFAIYAEEHKKEVPAGKGEGKGRSALAAKFAAEAEEVKKQLAIKQAEEKVKWEEEVKEFKAGEKYQLFEKTEKKAKMEMTNEALKVMQIKFFADAPTQPPRSPFAIFVHEKRKAQSTNGEPPAKKSRKEAAEEVSKFQTEWKKLDKPTQSEYDEKRKELYKEWEGKAKEYMELDCWKEYMAEAKRLMIPVKSLLSNKKNTVKRLANGMVLVALPSRPESFPRKPRAAHQLYIREKRQEQSSLEPEAAMELWKNEDAEVKKKYEDEAQEALTKYQEEMKEFTGSEEGKTFFKTLKMTRRRRTMTMAKFKFLKEMPKKPPGAFTVFAKQNLKAVKAAAPDLKGPELKKALEDRYKALDDEQRQAIEEEAKKKFEAFQEAMKEFKEGENWKSYSKIAKGKAKGKAKAKAKKVAERDDDSNDGDSDYQGDEVAEISD